MRIYTAAALATLSVLGASACGNSPRQPSAGGRDAGAADASTGDAAQPRPVGVVRTRSVPLPRAGNKSAAFWLSSGGGNATATTGSIGISLGEEHGGGGVAPTSTVFPGHLPATTE